MRLQHLKKALRACHRAFQQTARLDRKEEGHGPRLAVDRTFRIGLELREHYEGFQP